MYKPEKCFTRNKRKAVALSVPKHFFNIWWTALFFAILILIGTWINPLIADAKDSRSAALVINADTGLVLHQEHADELRYPASLTKMMTLYLVFEALEHNHLKLSYKLPVSKFAASQPPSKLGLKPGEKLSVYDAIVSLIVKSANDSAVILAEAIAGDEDDFAKLMTKRASQLGMTNTIFKNASGLPDPGQKTTAYDLGKLAIALKRDFPKYYPLFAKTTFNFKGRTYHTHNRVTKHYKGADGLKTGYINASGFNLVTSAKRGDKKLVGVVLGGDSAQSRDRKMVGLLNKFFGSHTSKDDYAPTVKTAKAKKATKVATKKKTSAKRSYKVASNKKSNKKKYS
jgi:D-alanyl-D-alanine carboxypeptidase